MSKKINLKNRLSIIKTKNNKIDISFPLPKWNWWKTTIFVSVIIMVSRFDGQTIKEILIALKGLFN